VPTAVVSAWVRPVPGTCPLAAVYSVSEPFITAPTAASTRISAMTRPRKSHFCFFGSSGEHGVGATLWSVQAMPFQYRGIPVPSGSGYQPGAGV